MKKEILSAVDKMLLTMSFTSFKKTLEQKNDVNSFFILNNYVYPLLWFFQSKSYPIKGYEESLMEEIDDLIILMDYVYA